MTVSLKSLGLEHLSVEDRLSLDESIWESIAADPATMPLAQAQLDEIEKRYDADDASPEQAIAWADVKALARARLRR